MNVQDVIRELDQKLLVAAAENIGDVLGEKIRTVATKKAVIVENVLAGLLKVPEADEGKLVEVVFDLTDDITAKLEVENISDALAKVRALTAEMSTGAIQPAPKPKKEKPAPAAAPAAAPADADPTEEAPEATAEAPAEAPAEKPKKEKKVKVPKPPVEKAGPSNLRKLTAVLCENVDKPRAEVIELVKALGLPVLDSTINAEYANVRRVYEVATELGMTK
jgi:hypothetical protein